MCTLSRKDVSYNMEETDASVRAWHSVSQLSSLQHIFLHLYFVFLAALNLCAFWSLVVGIIYCFLTTSFSAETNVYIC